MEGSQVFAAIFDHLTSQENPRPRFLSRHLHVPIGFVILKANIVTRPILFNESIFKQKGLFFTTSDHDLNISKLREQEANLYTAVPAARILAHTSTQIFRFTNVDHFPLGVFEEIYT